MCGHHFKFGLSIIFSFLSITTFNAATKLLPTPGAIVGSGRIGLFLFESNNKLDALISRDSRSSSINEIVSGPIYVCTRNDDLLDVINKTPPKRREDLVFLQNGILEPLLKEQQLTENTQGLIYFGVAKKGETPTDGKTSLNPEGLTAISGKWANDFKIRLYNAGLACHVMDKEKWEVAMFEKLIWISAFMIVGAKHNGCTVGEVEEKHKDEVCQIINEMANTVTKVKNVKFAPMLKERLCAYSQSVAHFPTALKEFKWRNGWFFDISLSCMSKQLPDPLPRHTAMLKVLRNDLFV